MVTREWVRLEDDICMLGRLSGVRVFYVAVVHGGAVARMEDTRLPECVMFEVIRGAGCVGGQEKEWMGCFLDDLRAFGINADQWMTAAQDEGGWRRTAGQGAERFMAK